MLVGTRVKLSSRAKDWKSGNTNIPQCVIDGLKFEHPYIIEDTTPILSVKGGNQQFASLEGLHSTYPTWCFEEIK